MFLDFLLENTHTLALLAVFIHGPCWDDGSGHFYVGLALGSANRKGKVTFTLLLHEAVAKRKTI